MNLEACSLDFDGCCSAVPQFCCLLSEPLVQSLLLMLWMQRHLSSPTEGAQGKASEIKPPNSSSLSNSSTISLGS